MVIARLLLAFVIAELCGIGIVCLLWPYGAKLSILLIGTLSVGLGLGLTSVVFFASLFVFDKPSLAIAAVETVVLLLLLGACATKWYRNRKISRLGGVSRSNVPLTVVDYVLLAAFAISLVLAGATFVRLSARSPHGAWDAWGIWNLRAKFLFLGGQQWRSAFSREGHLQHRRLPAAGSFECRPRLDLHRICDTTGSAGRGVPVHNVHSSS